MVEVGLEDVDVEVTELVSVDVSNQGEEVERAVSPLTVVWDEKKMKYFLQLFLIF